MAVMTMRHENQLVSGVRETMEHHKTVRFTIKNFLKFLSAHPDLLCIQLLPSHRFLLLFSLFVFIKPFHEHGIIIANVQNKEASEFLQSSCRGKEKKSKD
jgi:hypothetical protein